MTEPCPMVVFGYHDVGYRCLELLLARRETVRAVFTHADDVTERIWFRSVAGLAASRGIPVYTPASATDPAVIDQVRALGPALIFSFYYRHMIPTEILKLPRLGAFNMHGSLLPRYRGRVPVNWAIINGETETGATLHHMVRRADAGDIVDQQVVPIGPLDTARDVFGQVTDAAVEVLARNIEALKAGNARRTPQDERLATTFGGRRPEDGRIDWTQPAARIFNLVRALTEPYPGAFTTVGGRTLFVWWAQARALPGIAARPGEVVAVQPLVVATGDGGLEIQRLQWARAQEALSPPNFMVAEILGT
ncbi:MAG: formyltransferase [Acidiferrobacter sp.]